MLDRFEAYLRSVNMSENTVRSYGNDVRQFLKFVESRNIGVEEVWTIRPPMLQSMLQFWGLKAYPFLGRNLAKFDCQYSVMPKRRQIPFLVSIGLRTCFSIAASRVRSIF